MNLRSRCISRAAILVLHLFLLLLLTQGTWGEILSDPVSYTKETGAGFEVITFSNSSQVPVTLKLDWQLNNVSVRGPKEMLVLPAKGRVRGPRVERANPSSAWSYRWTYTYNFGSYAVEKPSTAFEIPWPRGQAFTVGQAFGGAKSHDGDLRYAVDFPMPEGVAIHAARAGLVTHLEQRYSEGGWRKDLFEKSNYVILAHTDGTLSRYLHLRHRGAAVHLGQWIDEGQLLGYSGNVGYSNGPHLHFEVCRPRRSDLKTASIPFRMLQNGQSVIPVEGMLFSH